MLPPIPGGTMGPGASGDVVQAYQQRLDRHPLRPGTRSTASTAATWPTRSRRCRRSSARPAPATIGPVEAAALANFKYPQPLQPNGEANRTEIDITKQVITLYQGYQVRLITTTSTGSGARYCYSTPRVNPTRRVCEYANTPSGRFTYTRFVSGWDKSPLGQLYNPFYFNGGIAMHGYEEVPTSPASHGCARIPMHIAEYWHTLVHVGDPVYVFGGTPEKIISSTPIAPTTTVPPTPPPAAPPVDAARHHSPGDRAARRPPRPPRRLPPPRPEALGWFRGVSRSPGRRSDAPERVGGLEAGVGEGVGRRGRRLRHRELDAEPLGQAVVAGALELVGQLRPAARDDAPRP